MKKYPIQRQPNKQRNYSVVPVAQPNIQIPSAFKVLNEGSKFNNHNVAGQIHTTIRLEDKNGNKLCLHQRQQILNLVNNTHNSFFVHDGSNNRRPIRRIKHGKR